MKDRTKQWGDWRPTPGNAATITLTDHTDGVGLEVDFKFIDDGQPSCSAFYALVIRHLYSSGALDAIIDQNRDEFVNLGLLPKPPEEKT